ncbi:hypothetical protein [Beijerinckia sp. L45]|uniref:hypothetical protein n=1 Tax=Beijerinckia sp. L45 TaxID=1641855 RepID=UPI00131BF627|nr:hypothetical protein [Beijerinckia sp. L45]
MSQLPMKIIGFSFDELAHYTCAQIASFYPDGSRDDNYRAIRKSLAVALERLSVCTKKVVQWRLDEFDPMNSSQHSTFLYLLANTVWRDTASEAVPTKLFLLNKALHGIEMFFKIEMPPVFLLGHTVGIVLSNTTYGNYFAIFQNSTVGRLGNDRPTIGKGVLMFPNTSIVGRCNIGDNTTISQGTYVVNTDSPGNVTIFSSGGRHPLIKCGRSNAIELYFRDMDL